MQFFVHQQHFQYQLNPATQDWMLRSTRESTMRLIALCMFVLLPSLAWGNARFVFVNEFGRDGNGISRLDNPWRMSTDPATGDIAVADSSKNRIAIFDRNGSFKSSFGIAGHLPGQLSAPAAAVFLPERGGLLVADTGNNRIQLFERSGRFVRTFGPDGGFAKPTGLAITSSGQVFVADSGNNQVQVFSADGSRLMVLGGKGNALGQFETPYDVALHPDGRQFAVADYGNHRIQLFDMDGKLLSTIGAFGKGRQQFWGAAGVAYTRDGTLLVADASNRRIQWFNLENGSSGEFGGIGDTPGKFAQPHAITTDWHDDAIYVSDFYLNRIQEFRDTSAASPSLARYVQPAVAAPAIIGSIALGLIFFRRGRREASSKPLPSLIAIVRRTWRARPSVPGEWLFLATSLIATLFLNGTFWDAATASPTGSPAITGIWRIPLALLLVAAQFVPFALLVPRILIKPLMLLYIGLSVVIGFYMRRYHVYMDVTMMQNVLATNGAEAGQQINRAMIVQLTLWLVACAAILSFFKARNDSMVEALRRRARHLGIVVLLAAASALVMGGRLKTLIEEQPEILHLLNPTSALVNLPLAYSSGALPTNEELVPIGTDARAFRVHERPRLFVLVIGETTRAASWGLSGYSRNTTPSLEQRKATNFSDVTSCGSNTLVSVPCIFSPGGRRQYDVERIQRSENLLHVLARAGFKTSWIENSDTCVGVCRGIPTLTLSPSTIDGCGEHACMDEKLIDALWQLLEEQPLTGTNRSDQVVVLHMAGNHGPGYHGKYPREFALFQPECLSNDIRGCDDRSTLNSYENSILYTDHVLGKLMDSLQAHPEYASAMLFTSDHGESLGENGIYMHGTPYPIAPKEQLKVPMVFWASPEFAEDRGLDLQCIRDQAQRPTTHDSVFHTTLNLLAVDTRIYDPYPDWSANCMSGNLPGTSAVQR